jgi:hypothetical protein
MKQILIATLLTALSALPAFADGRNPRGFTDLNSTPAQLAARYGKPVKVEKGWYGAGLSYSFQPNKELFVYATTNPQGTKVEDVVYKSTGKPFTYDQKEYFLLINSNPHISYYGDCREFDQDTDWDGTESVKHLGKERNLTVKSDLNWTHQIVAKDTDDSGYQLRTKAQFDVEQKFIE